MFNNWCFFNGLDPGDLFDKKRREKKFVEMRFFIRLIWIFYRGARKRKEEF